jgi:hypothetical protein
MERYEIEIVLFADDKIANIKGVRAAFYIGLKEAKDIVEAAVIHSSHEKSTATHIVVSAEQLGRAYATQILDPEGDARYIGIYVRKKIVPDYAVIDISGK